MRFFIYQSTARPLLSTLYEPLHKQLISVLGAVSSPPQWHIGMAGQLQRRSTSGLADRSRRIIAR